MEFKDYLQYKKIEDCFYFGVPEFRFLNDEEKKLLDEFARNWERKQAHILSEFKKRNK